jgi:hypothetical protein
MFNKEIRAVLIADTLALITEGEYLEFAGVTDPRRGPKGERGHRPRLTGFVLRRLVCSPRDGSTSMFESELNFDPGVGWDDPYIRECVPFFNEAFEAFRVVSGVGSRDANDAREDFKRKYTQWINAMLAWDGPSRTFDAIASSDFKNAPTLHPPAPPSGCSFGVFCSLHQYDHGGEAEELRKRIETLIDDHTDYSGTRDAVVGELARILEDVDARDSSAWCEARPKRANQQQLFSTAEPPEGFEFMARLPVDEASVARFYRVALPSPNGEVVSTAFLSNFRASRPPGEFGTFELKAPIEGHEPGWYFFDKDGSMNGPHGTSRAASTARRRLVEDPDGQQQGEVPDLPVERNDGPDVSDGPASDGFAPGFEERGGASEVHRRQIEMFETKPLPFGPEDFGGDEYSDIRLESPEEKESDK